MKIEDRGMDFGQALGFLRAGAKVARAVWSGEGQHLGMQYPDEHNKMTVPYIYLTTVQGDRVTWFASQPDVLALDWMVV